ncbi:hypothetical protein FQA47_017582 [Oryzias melastigma]|uniref:Uncharacterized protein n=1 Tax=Oryzias melastigma TaxID=30732 RepID=A0A834FCN0_ORYME|nr:hypothetical protein FQA47_017582 [Oryzias melastigma]
MLQLSLCFFCHDYNYVRTPKFPSFLLFMPGLEGRGYKTGLEVLTRLRGADLCCQELLQPAPPPTLPLSDVSAASVLDVQLDTEALCSPRFTSEEFFQKHSFVSIYMFCLHSRSGATPTCGATPVSGGGLVLRSS